MNPVRELFLLLLRQPGHRLVEEEELRLGGEGAPELHTLLDTVGTIGHATLAHRLQVEELDDFLAPAPVTNLLAAQAQRRRQEVLSKVEMPSDHEVVEDGHVVEETEVLERPRDAEPRHRVGRPAEERFAAKADRPRCRMVDPADAVEQRRLARAVGADDGKGLAFGDRDVDVLQRVDPAEAQREIPDLEQVGHGVRRG